MKKYILSCFLIYSINNIKAQVGFSSNNPNKDAALDLNNTNGSNTKGLLLPNVALSAANIATPLSAHTAGMHVYNTATSGSGVNMVTPGEYYNNGSKWIRIAGTSWAIGGNTATTPGTNAIGTSDENDFAVRTNNAVRTRITTNGNVLVGTTTVPTGGSGAKLIVNNGTTKGALQIKDGTQQDGATLMSDANGLARWQKTGDLTTVYRSTVAQTFGTLSNVSNNFTTLQTSQPMKITTKGTYISTLRWWGNSDGPNANGVTSAYIALFKNGVKVDEIEYYYTTAGIYYYTFNVTLLAPDCAVNDVLTIGIRSSVGNAATARNWYTGGAGASNPAFMPSVIVSKL
ncbi:MULTISPECIES: hypothetical protein [Flavobacterium]|uniref:hypothetical protein n=1 Tax=Flavobacterium TaxID=237 RepID=UPI0011840F1C|nr:MULTISPECIES: hypothetical protein [Flavobacterium]MCR4033583.1 hypothetical protein [Flavobacterium panacis]